MAQADSGDDVYILCRESDPPLVDLLRGHGVRVVTSGTAPRRKIGELLCRADVVHVHTVKGLFDALRRAPWAYWRKSVSTYHNPHQRSTLLLLVARRVVVLNSRDAKRLSRLNPLARPTIIRNGVVGSRRVPPVESVQAERLPVRSIVYVGALHRRKGVDVLLEAVAIMRQDMPDVHLYIVGNRDAVEFEQLATELEITDCTTFVGFRSDPRGFMQGAGVFVLPSRDEGFGNVLTEARSVGAPIVASRVGGIPEALDGGVAGMLVPSENPAALAAALKAVLTNEVTRVDLIRRARTGLETLSVGRFRDDYLQVYQSLSTGNRRPYDYGRNIAAFVRERFQCQAPR